MKRTLVLPLLLVLPFLYASAQKDVPDFGKIDITDLQMKQCPFEPEANAMKLFEVEETELDWRTYTMRLKSERRIRIKIFNEKGYEHATIRIPYFSKKGVAKIKELSGAVYSLNPDGKVVVQKLDKKEFFKEKATDNVGLVIFTFPNLRPGSVIEYRYTTIENDAFYVPTWHIQDEIPVRYSAKSVSTPVQYRLVDRPFGIDSLSSSWYLYKNDEYRRLTYFHENIPSFKVEPFMGSINDHRIKASFILFSRGGSSGKFDQKSIDLMWASSARNFIKSPFFEEKVYKTIPGTEKLIDSAKKMLTTKEKVGFVYNEVKKRAAEKIERAFSVDNLEEAWTNRSANSTEINLILLNLLLKSEVPSMPVMVSTREHGKVDKDFPSVGQFDGFDVLALDSNTHYLLDASIKHQSFLNPPLNVMNREVFLIGKDSAQWLLVTDPRPLYKQLVNVIADLDKDGKLAGTGTVQHYDYAKSFKLDTSLKDDEKDDRFYDNTPQGLKILSTSLSEPGNDDDPLFETIDFTYEPQTSDDFIFINPQILVERNKSPFVAEKRIADIDFGCNQLSMLTMQINLTGNYVVEHLPENTIVKAPDSSFIYKITYTANDSRVDVYQTLETKRSVFNKDEYAGIQEFFKQMHGLMSKEIILKKKK